MGEVRGVYKGSDVLFLNGESNAPQSGSIDSVHGEGTYTFSLTWDTITGITGAGWRVGWNEYTLSEVEDETSTDEGALSLVLEVNSAQRVFRDNGCVIITRVD